jgi:TPR repeat protein
LLETEGKTVVEGVELLDGSCRLGYADACERLFSIYEHVPEARSRDIAARLAESECAASATDEESCVRAARAFAAGWGVPVDTGKAERYRQRACAMVQVRCRKSAERRPVDGKPKHGCIDFAHACEPR